MDLIRDFLTWRFFRHFIIKLSACAGALSTMAQMWSVIYPNSPIFRNNPISTLIIMLIISIIVGLVWSWPRPIEEEYSAPNTRIRIIKGDLFEQDQHLVIGMCDTFDTATPNIIAVGSLQGQALNILFGGDVQEMDRLLHDALNNKLVIGTINKPGKRNKYGIGTVLTIRHAARRLFLLAYCEMNERNEAHGTIDGVWKSLMNLWAEISAQSNGTVVSIPVIGGGQARGLSSILPAQDSIRLIALSFMFFSRTQRICDELRIIVRPKDFERLDRLEIQSFLSSLRPS